MADCVADEQENGSCKHGSQNRPQKYLKHFACDLVLQGLLLRLGVVVVVSVPVKDLFSANISRDLRGVFHIQGIIALDSCSSRNKEWVSR